MFFSRLKFCILILLSCFFVQANTATFDVVGTWTLSGVGCRDVNLSPSSHVSKYVSEGF